MYTWNRYSLISSTTTTYTLSHTNDPHNVSYSKNQHVIEWYIFDSSTGLFKAPNTHMISFTNIPLVDTYEYWTIGESTDYNGNSTMSPTKCHYGYGGSYGRTYTTALGYGSVITNTNTSHSQGSYIDQVTSTNSSAYPYNGQSGSYWYVFQG